MKHIGEINWKGLREGSEGWGKSSLKSFGDESGLSLLGVLHHYLNAGGITLVCAFGEGV